MKKFRQSSNVERKVFFAKNIFLFIGQNICGKKFAEKKIFGKILFFWKRKCEWKWMLPEEYFIRLEHLENLIILTLIMWEIRSSYSGMKGKEMSSNTWDKTSMIGRLLFNNELDNLDKQLCLDEVFIQCRDNQCFYALRPLRP